MDARLRLSLSVPVGIFLFAASCGQEGTGRTSSGDSGTSSTSSSGAGGGSSSSSSGGTACSTPKDCPATPNQCVVAMCEGGVCSTVFAPAGTPLVDPTPGDCQSASCDGNGGLTSVADDADLPVDNNECTTDVCAAGVPSNEAIASGASCGQGMFCDGAGACVECLAPADCPGQDNDCQSRTCVGGACGVAFVAVGTPTPAATQMAGDCKVSQCDGAGVAVIVNDDADLPVDGIECTNDVCTAGAPSNPASAKSTPCGQGMICDGAGACVGCADASECPGQDNECQSRTCIAMKCGISFVAAGTPVAMQMPGDCKVNQCDGAGAVMVANYDIDVPFDGTTCTDDICTAGAPSNPPVATGTACNENGGLACNAAGMCVPTFVVVRVGDGAAALSSAATPAFLEQYLLDGTLIVKANNPLALPTMAAGNNRPLTLSGTSTFDGGLSLSANGSYLVLAGYDAPVGTATVGTTTAMAVNRIVARVDAMFNVDTSTRLNAAFSGSNVRGATSVDGTAFWVCGNSSGASGGMHYALLGALGSTQILTAPSNARGCHIQAGQLFGSSGTSPFTNVFSVGVGTPTMAGQVATSLPGMPTMTASPDSFAVFDRNPNVAGVDTVYVADDRSIANGGGVQKYTFDGATWTLAATFVDGITTGVRGLAGQVTGSNVALLATTTNSKVVVYVDDGSMAPPGTVVVTAGANTAFRGIAFSPQ